jgi:phage terminase large subunit
MRTYSYKLDRLSGDIRPDLVDKANHTIDAIRYALLPALPQEHHGDAGVLSRTI